MLTYQHDIEMWSNLGPSTLEVEIDFKRIAGHAGDEIDPPTDDAVEVLVLRITEDGERVPQPVEAWFGDRILADPDLAKTLLDHADATMQAALCDAAETRRKVA